MYTSQQLILILVLSLFQGQGYSVHSLNPVNNNNGKYQLSKSGSNLVYDSGSLVFRDKIYNRDLPDFQVTTLNGGTLTTQDLKGKIVVLNFWFIACKPCVMEIPELNELSKKYIDRKDIIFIAPALDKEEAVIPFLEQKTFSYQIVPGAAKLIKETFGIREYPTHIVANKAGKIIYSVSGYSPGFNGKGSTVDKLAEVIAAELNEN